MESQTVIDCKNITKEYRLFSNQKNKLFELLLHKDKMTTKYALKDISFTLSSGECLALLGFNGSGKTTLANIISGIVSPTKGSISVVGDAANVSVSVGLNPNLTGIENIRYKGLLLGFSNEEIEEIAPKVIDFAEIGEYIKQPVKIYSSGMSARLGFAISINIDPDILVIDEGLSVGDASFTDKCINAMNKYRERGKTIVFISHSLSTVKQFCTKAIWLEFGKKKMEGNTLDVCAAYTNYYEWYTKMSASEKEAYAKSV